MALSGFSQTALLLLVALAASVHGVCQISGTWKTEHGTIVNINASSNGYLTGTYRNSISDPPSNLTGYQQPGDQPIFGFTVKSNSSASTTLIAGQCFTTTGGEPVWKTMWLRRDQVDNITDNWKTVRIGAADFFKN